MDLILLLFIVLVLAAVFGALKTTDALRIVLIVVAVLLAFALFSRL